MGNNHRSKFAGLDCLRRKLASVPAIAVIATFAILIGLIVPKIVSSPDEAKRAIAKQEIATIVQALNLYYRDHGRYPTQEPGLRALTERPGSGAAQNTRKNNNYLQRLPNDPWGNPYQYRNPGVHGQIDVFSFGADGRQGGEGDDADIGSWE